MTSEFRDFVTVYFLFYFFKWIKVGATWKSIGITFWVLYTPEQKKQWLIERTYCVYYVFAPENHEISSTYVKSLLDNVKKFEEAIKFFKKMGITISKKKQEIGIEIDKTQE